MVDTPADGLPSPPPPRPAFSLPPRPFGGIGTAVLKPQSATLKLKFTERDLGEASLDSKQWKLTIAERMRYLDDARKHSPLADECAFLNIPEGRLDLHTLKSILHVCGGCSGARFSTEDFSLSKDLITKMEIVWKDMEIAYKALSAAQRKVVLDQSYIISASSSSDEKDDTTTGEDVGVDSGGDDDTDDEDKETEEMPLPEGVDAEVVGFHRKADQWSLLADKAQDLVKTKQASLPSTEERKALIASFASGDPDGLDKAKAMPDWLETILEKYKSEGVPMIARSVENGTLNKDGKVPSSLQVNPDTVGKICCFMSFMVVGHIPVAEGKEQSALREVLQASNDSQKMLTNDDDLPGIVANEKCGNGRGQDYWARRLYNFMSKVRELKGMVKEDRALQYPHIWLS